MLALSLWKDDKNHIYDVLRNIQLANLFFPAWVVRIYIPINAPNNHTLTLPANILKKQSQEEFHFSRNMNGLKL